MHCISSARQNEGEVDAGKEQHKEKNRPFLACMCKAGNHQCAAKKVARQAVQRLLQAAYNRHCNIAKGIARFANRQHTAGIATLATGSRHCK
jgi:hypothetical protein